MDFAQVCVYCFAPQVDKLLTNSETAILIISLLFSLFTTTSDVGQKTLYKTQIVCYVNS